LNKGYATIIVVLAPGNWSQDKGHDDGGQPEAKKSCSQGGAPPGKVNKEQRPQQHRIKVG
jgi:hypothetical protein